MAGVTGNGWEANKTEKQLVKRIIVSEHAGSLSVMSPGAQPHAPEIRTRKWTWVRGGRTVRCYCGTGVPA